MKTAIYIEDGTVQLVITPESEFERNAMGQFVGKELQPKLFTGAFYDCRGGWIRQREFYPGAGHPRFGSDNDSSLMLRVDKAPPVETPGFDQTAKGN